jgi:secondary thiamine-phosphate synthase enzyme
VRQELSELVIHTGGRALCDVTARVAAWLGEIGAERGLLTLLVRHTSASLLIQENADPDVLRDLETFFARLVRDGDPAFAHRAEGPDDMSAHVRCALTQTSLAIPVERGAMCLGTWQAIYLYEHRHAHHQRHVAVHYLGT